jgi:hypothetical protein
MTNSSYYSVTYYKPDNSPQLLARGIADRDDLRIQMTAAKFLANAWRLANKRRESSAGSCRSARAWRQGQTAGRSS